MATSLGGRDAQWGLVLPLSYQELEFNALWGQKMMQWIHMSQGVENDIENKMKNYQRVAIPVLTGKISTQWQKTAAKQLICLSLSWELW